MNIKLYNVSDPPNKVSKSLGTEKVISNVRFIDDGSLDVENPTVLLNISNKIKDNVDFNYAYIPALTRYYWIDRLTTEGGLVRMALKVDPLMSFKKDIIGSLQYVSRSENVVNRYLVDNLMPISSKHLYSILPFGTQAYDENCIYVLLETAGKGGI